MSQGSLGLFLPKKRKKKNSSPGSGPGSGGYIFVSWMDRSGLTIAEVKGNSVAGRGDGRGMGPPFSVNNSDDE